MLTTTNEIENEMLFGLTLHFLVLLSKQKSQIIFNLTRNHFPPRHKLFNTNTIKVSYSYMPNIKAEINKHNKNISEKGQQKHPDTQLCNCTNKKQCPLNRQCLTESIVYQANITANIPGYKEKVYRGVSETKFKIRYGKHKKSFTKQSRKNDTELR